MDEREEIALARARGEGVRAIARSLRRSASTISRELARNRGWHSQWCYRASTAQARADRMARRPKPAKLAVNDRLRQPVQTDLEQRWSPQQIAQRLREEFPDDPEMQVSPETI